MAEPIFRSFVKGEISPYLSGRADTVAYATGLKTCRNFMVQKFGGVQNRPGTEFVREVKDSTKAVRLLPFVFNDAQTYVLEFGDKYVRFFHKGAVLSAGTVAAWSNVTNYVIGDLAKTAGINYYCVKAHNNIAQPNATYWYAMPAGVYEIPSPYAHTDLELIKYVQSADVITFTHPSYQVQELKRYATNTWLFLSKTFVPAINPPVNLANNGAFPEAQYTINGYTAATPARITSSVAHGRSTGDVIQLDMDFLVPDYIPYYTHQRFTGSYKVTVISATEVSLQNVDGSNFSFGFRAVPELFQSGNFSAQITGAFNTTYVVTAIDPVTGEESLGSVLSGTTSIPTSGVPVTLTWTAISGIKEYNIYKQSGSVLYGFIGSTSQASFLDNGIIPDISFTPPSMDKNVFQATNGFPATVGYYQQRLLLGNTNTNVEEVFASRTGNFKNFSARDPLLDDDALSFVMAGEKVSAIKHFLNLGKLVILTQNAEFAEGDASGTFTPSSLNFVQHSTYGASDVKPIIIGSSALFVQGRGTHIRDLAFDIRVNGYTGNDLTQDSSHLFMGKTISEWCYQQNPNSIAWCVMSDGALLGMTYVKEEQVLGWHRHDTDGKFKSITCVPEDENDIVYVVVERIVNGSTVKYIENFSVRDKQAVIDMVMMDCALTYDGRNTTAMTMQISGADYSKGQDVSITSSGAYFDPSDVGKAIHFTDSTGRQVRLKINTYNSNVVVTAKANRNIPVELQNVATAVWAKGVTSVSGLGHLEGKAVSILGDAFVLASPNNSEISVTRTVTGGSVSLTPASNPQTYAVVHVGLPYTSDVETLDIEEVQNGTIMQKAKLVNNVTLRLVDSRAVYAGRTLVGNGTQGLERMKYRQNESMDSPNDPFNGTVILTLATNWDRNGRVVVRCVDPVPMNLLNISPGLTT